MRSRLFRRIVVALAAVAITACGTTGAVTTVTVGFGHSQATTEYGATDAFGWGVGASVGLSFAGSGISAVEVCSAGGLEFGSSFVDDGDLTVSANRVPVSLCTEIDTSPDDE